MNKPLLFDYFEKTADILLAKYERSSLQNASKNLGDNREIFCRNFLERVLPPRLKVASGEVWDSFGNKSGEEDIIILREDVATLEFETEHAYLVEGVLAVIEIKSNLQKDKLIEAANNLEKIKNLKIQSSASMSYGNPKLEPLRIIFSYKGADLNTLKQEIIDKKLEGLFDLICVLERGIIVKKGNLLNWSNGDTLGISNGKASPLAFLYYYLITYGSNLISKSMNLSPYFEPFNLWDAP